jgi:hypothetical protein
MQVNSLAWMRLEGWGRPGGLMLRDASRRDFACGTACVGRALRSPEHEAEQEFCHQTRRYAPLTGQGLADLIAR